MANNRIILKRTSTSGRTPNTTGSYATNSQYISAGELALNMADGILYSSNGSAVIEIGANNTNVRVTGNLTVNGIVANGSSGTSGQVLKSNGTSTYWATDNADVGAAGQILYRNSSNVLTTSSGLQYDGVSIKVNGNLESTYQSGDEGGEIFLNKPVTNTSITNGITIDVFQNRLRFFENGGNNRGAYIDITAAANGVGSNLLTGGGGGGGTVTSVGSGNGLTGGPITSSGTLSVLANNGITANSTGLFAVSGLGTVVNSIGINVNANNGLTATAAGLFVTGNTGIVANATGVYVNAAYINTISSNNASFLGGTAAASYVQNTDSRTLSGNLTFTGITTFSSNVNIGNTSGRVDVIQRSSNATVNVVSRSTTATQPGGSLTNYFTRITTQSTGRYVETSLESTSTRGGLDVFTTNDNNQIYSSISASATGSTTASLDVQYQDNVLFNSSRILATTANNSATISIEKNSAQGTYINTAEVKVWNFSDGANSVVNTIAVSTSNSVIYGGGRLTLVSNAGISANGSLGTAGQVLHSNGSSAYWADDDQGVTSVATGNGLTGGTITTTGTVSVLANTGIVANATGLYVNASYIATIAANSASFLGGNSASDLRSYSDTTAATAYSNAISVASSDATTKAGNAYSNAVAYVDGKSFVNTAQLSTNLANYQTTAGLAGNVATLTSNNATNLNGVAAANYVQNTDSRTLSGNLVFSGANVNFTGNLRITGGLIANGSLGTANQVLATNGSSIYWANGGSGATSSITRQLFNGDGINTTFTVTGGYTAGQIDVYLNGVKQVNGTDVTVTSGTNVVFASPPPSGSIIEVTAITVSNVVTANEVGGYYKGGATTAGSSGNANNIFRINGKILYNNTSINSDENASCAGPINISSGVVLNVAPGGRIVII